MNEKEEQSLKIVMLYNAYADKVHRSRLRAGAGRALGVFSGGGALLGALAGGLDYLTTGGANLYQAMQFAYQDLRPFIMLLEPRDYVEYAILGITGITLVSWGIDQLISREYHQKDQVLKTVFSVPHYSTDSEMQMFARIASKKPEEWQKAKSDYFNELSEWSHIARIASALYEKNFRIEGSIPSSIFDGDYAKRLTTEEIIEGTKSGEMRSLNLKNAKHISFQLERQPNQAQGYFEGIAVNSAQLPNYLGPETLIWKLSTGETVIGSVSKTRPSGGKKDATLENLIRKEALSPYYPYKNEKNLRIAVVTEGTYPFVRGGVATVIDDMMRGLKPEYMNTDSLVFEAVSLWVNQGPFNTRVNYPIPQFIHLNPPINIYGYSDNPAFHSEMQLPDEPDPRRFGQFAGSKDERHRMVRARELKSILLSIENAICRSDVDTFFNIASKMQYFSLEELVESPEAINAVHEMYHTEPTLERPDFMTYFYHWQSLREPLFRIIKSDLVEAECYYSVVTGLGGVYSALAKRRYGAGLVLTEHGIYNEDRMVELANSSIPPLFASKWAQAFKFYSDVIYHEADYITTTCKCNSYKQIRDGAPEHKLRIIPGSISVTGSEYDKDAPIDPNKFTVGLLGNVQRVKRVEIFIEVAKYLTDLLPDANFIFHVMGRDDDRDPAYVSQIHNLVKQRNLTNLFFSPYTDYRAAFANLDCGVLTSASEVQPRSIMEIMSMGKPMVAPDVGGIREILYGTDDNGQPGIDTLGAAGIVVDVGSHESMITRTADAILTLYYRRQLLNRIPVKDIPQRLHGTLDVLLHQPVPMEEVGHQRMKNYCERSIVIPQYAELFKRSMGQ